MRLELSHPCMAAFDPAKDTRVLIACEDWTAAEQARGALARIGSNCEGEGRLLYNCWNFEVLEVPNLRKIAAREAARMDIIVVAMNDRTGLPDLVDEWIGDWLAIPNYRCRALVAFVVSDTLRNNRSAPIFAELKKLAELGEIDFFTARTKKAIPAARERAILHA